MIERRSDLNSTISSIQSQWDNLSEKVKNAHNDPYKGRILITEFGPSSYTFFEHLLSRDEQIYYCDSRAVITRSGSSMRQVNFYRLFFLSPFHPLLTFQTNYYFTNHLNRMGYTITKIQDKKMDDIKNKNGEAYLLTYFNLRVPRNIMERDLVFIDAMAEKLEDDLSAIMNLTENGKLDPKANSYTFTF